MASTEEYRDFILEQLSEVPNITCRPMMGEFLLYSNNVLFGGIYDDRLLVKIVPENKQYKMSESIPYDGAKPMFLVEDVGDKEKLTEIVNATVKGIY
jgi:TfoX/Sxy family transcriptional regulator of competence genes